MIINNEVIQNFSRISSRGVFGQALIDISKENEDLKVVVADVSSSARLTDIEADKIINVGIAEQNMIGIAAGLASEGKLVYATSFAPFASMRCYEMIRTQLGYMNLNVKVVGLMSGLAGGVVGNTHYGLEDIAIMRAIPNMTVLSPADGLETYKAVQASAYFDGPCYIRLTGINGFTPIYKEDYDFKIGKAIKLKEGCDIAIIATGTMVGEAIRASRALNKYNISSTVIDMHTIKPIDKEVVKDVFENHKLVVTLEEHSIIGGMGSAVAEYASSLKNVAPQLLLGIPDKFGKVGDYMFMLKQYGLTAPQIVEKILENYQKYL